MKSTKKRLELRREREREARRKAIIDAAIRVFARRGHRASMDEIADEAELGKATIYYYFTSKDQIFWKALETYSREFFQRLYDELKDEMELVEMVRRLFESYIDFFRDNIDFLRIYLPAELGLLEIGGGSKEFDNVHREHRMRLSGMIEMALKKGGIDMEPERFMKVLMYQLIGLGSDILLGEDPRRGAEAFIQLLELMVRGER
ncbi:helix-turn-helix transcriptional regulator [Candidatus Poribacteria bacterium]|nr:helix-turn-helix transcriptional regulator [Candidatus Poribacteria bacterium]